MLRMKRIDKFFSMLNKRWQAACRIRHAVDVCKAPKVLYSKDRVLNVQAKPVATSHDDWKKIKRKASTQKSVQTTAQNSYDKIIQIKRCTEATEHFRQMHHALKQQK